MGRMIGKDWIMSDTIYNLLMNVVSRSSFVNDWWKGNPSKDCLSEDDENLLSSQLDELEYEVKKLQAKIDEMKNIIG